jgi:hypothetical protein
MEQSNHVRDQRVDIHGDRLGALLAEQCAQSPDDPGRPLGVRRDVGQRLPDVFTPGSVAQKTAG